MTHSAAVLLYVRHAEVFNPENLLYGRLPRFRLSDYGKYFAERTARYLQAEPIAVFYTSPLLRARQTTRILACPHPEAPIRVRSELAEVRTSWQGTAYHQLPEGRTVYETRRAPTDETIQDVWNRMRRLAESLVDQHQGQTIACVSHGDPIKILTLGFQGRELDDAAVRQPDPARCSVTRFAFEQPGGRPTITYTDVVGGPSFRRVASLCGLAPGSLTPVMLDKREVLLVRTSDGQVFALANRCSHMRAHLHEGVLEGNVVTCPLHGSQFAAADGALLQGPRCGTTWTANFGQLGRPLAPIEAGPLPTYDVRVEADDVLIRPR